MGGTGRTLGAVRSGSNQVGGHWLESSLYWIGASSAFLISIFFSVAEGALIGFSRAKLEELVKNSKKKQKIDEYLQNTDALLISCLTLDTIANICLVVFITVIYLNAYPGKLYGLLYAMGICFLSVLLFGEIVPRTLGSKKADRILVRILPLLDVTRRVMRPLLIPIEFINRIFGRIWGIREKRSSAKLIEAEILSAALEGEREGVLDEEEADMIESIVEFKDVEASEVMTPRTDMVCLEANASLNDAIKLALEKGHSRIPVYEKRIDKIIGILYVKDLLKLWGSDDIKEKPLRDLVRKAYYVPETKEIGDLLKEFKKKKLHIAIVLDEYGGTAGLATIEDILEEIVGEIEDEYDTEPRIVLKKNKDGEIEIDAKIHIDEINEELGIDLPEDDDFDTVGGFLFSSMGKVPNVGEHYIYKDMEFTILDADERKINRIKLRLNQ
jgi:CBS domain containing-hemolysin-like protein